MLEPELRRSETRPPSLFTTRQTPRVEFARRREQQRLKRLRRCRLRPGNRAATARDANLTSSRTPPSIPRGRKNRRRRSEPGTSNYTGSPRGSGRLPQRGGSPSAARCGGAPFRSARRVASARRQTGGSVCLPSRARTTAVNMGTRRSWRRSEPPLSVCDRKPTNECARGDSCTRLAGSTLATTRV